MKVLIIGLGSIAKKHIQVLNELSDEVKFYALRSDPKAPNFPGVSNLYSWAEIDEMDFHFALISSPSSLHLHHVKLLGNRFPLMIEKPVFTTLDQIEEFGLIKDQPELSYVACNLRFHPVISFLKQYLQEYPIKINEVSAYCGSYLPEWRPNQDYKNSYSASKKLGGGVHLDLIHEPDYIVYLFGLPNHAKRVSRKVSSLQIDTCDYSNMIFNYNSFHAQITLNYYRRDKKRTIEVVREDDTIYADFEQGIVKNLTTGQILFNEPNKELSIISSYKRQMAYFLECIEKKETPMNNINEAIKILEFVL